MARSACCSIEAIFHFPFITLFIMKHLLLPALCAVALLTSPVCAQDTPTAKSQLDVVAHQGASITSALCSPLEKSLPDYRSIIAALRDDLLDESVEAPVYSPATYQSAAQLCDTWLTSLNTRDQYLGSKDLKLPPTTDLRHGLKAHLHPADYVELLREKGNEQLHKQSDEGTNRFFSDAIKKEWSDQCIQFAQKMDTQFRNFRALRRQTLIRQSR